MLYAVELEERASHLLQTIGADAIESNLQVVMRHALKQESQDSLYNHMVIKGLIAYERGGIK